MLFMLYHGELYKNCILIEYTFYCRYFEYMYVEMALKIKQNVFFYSLRDPLMGCTKGSTLIYRVFFLIFG